MMEATFQFKIGEFDCLAINDGGYAGNAEMLFANAPPDELERSLQRYNLKPDHLPSTWTCLLVNTGHQIVLIDTGVGPGLAVGGNLQPLLQAEGIPPAAVDAVILTHGHGDHIGGVLDDEGDVAFPNATFYMAQEEWNYWTTETAEAEESEWAANFARQKLRPLTPVLQPIIGDQEIVPGIWAMAAPGHTVGHTAVHLASQGKHLLFLADVALHPIHLEQPDWCGQVDHDAAQTAMTRRKIFHWVVKNEALVLAFHFLPFPSLGHIIQNGEAWKWQPQANPKGEPQ